jgi:hypothetical protein
VKVLSGQQLHEEFMRLCIGRAALTCANWDDVPAQIKAAWNGVAAANQAAIDAQLRARDPQATPTGDDLADAAEDTRRERSQP